MMELSLVKSFHHRWIFQRRVAVLSTLLAEMIPPAASVLDVGCGDGSIGKLIAQKQPGVAVHGLEVMARPVCELEYSLFDGTRIPYPDASFDVCLFVDVLHHSDDPAQLLGEAVRVSRRYVVIKDHLCENAVDAATLRFMDWVGNRPHGVRLTYNYKSRREWDALFAAAGLGIRAWKDSVPLQAFPISTVFSRKLHFIALLAKESARIPT
jgi:SAM-dependent methyltransferase